MLNYTQEVIDVTKQDILTAVNDLPDNISVDDVMYRLYILAKHQRAMNDIKTGNVYTSEEIRSALIGQ